MDEHEAGKPSSVPVEALKELLRRFPGIHEERRRQKLAWAQVECARLKRAPVSALSRLEQCLDSELGRWNGHPIVLGRCALQFAAEARRESPGKEALDAILHRLELILERPERYSAWMLKRKLEACSEELFSFLRADQVARPENRQWDDMSRVERLACALREAPHVRSINQLAKRLAEKHGATP